MAPPPSSAVWRDQANSPSPNARLIASRERSRELLAPIEARSQGRYEKGLLLEIERLKLALAEERDLIAASKKDAEATDVGQKKLRAIARARASRLAEMEAALEKAQLVERREFVKRRNAAGERIAERDAEAAAKRAADQRKKEQQRQVAAELHRATIERHLQEAEAANAAKRSRDVGREQAMRRRMAEAQRQTQERNQQKSDVAADKIERAAAARVQSVADQRAAFHERHEAQEERMRQLHQRQQAHQRQVKKEAEAKRQHIESTQQNMRAREVSGLCRVPVPPSLPSPPHHDLTPPAARLSLRSGGQEVAHHAKGSGEAETARRAR